VPPVAVPVAVPVLLARAGGESTAAVAAASRAVGAALVGVVVLLLPAVDAVGDAGDGVPVVPVAAGADALVLGVAERWDSGVAVLRTAGAGVTAPVGAVSRVVAPARATARVAASRRRASAADVALLVSTFSSPRLVTGLGVALSVRERADELAEAAALTAGPEGWAAESPATLAPAGAALARAVVAVADESPLAGVPGAAVIAALSPAAVSSAFSPPLHAVSAARVSTQVATLFRIRPASIERFVAVIVGFVIGK
jgi:hypothetical protein